MMTLMDHRDTSPAVDMIHFARSVVDVQLERIHCDCFVVGMMTRNDLEAVAGSSSNFDFLQSKENFF